MTEHDAHKVLLPRAVVILCHQLGVVVQKQVVLWREWLNINDETAYKKFDYCTETMELRNLKKLYLI